MQGKNFQFSEHFLQLFVILIESRVANWNCNNKSLWPLFGIWVKVFGTRLQLTTVGFVRNRIREKSFENILRLMILNFKCLCNVHMFGFVKRMKSVMIVHEAILDMITNRIHYKNHWICIVGKLDTNCIKISNNYDERMDIKCTPKWILMTRGGKY